MNLFSLLPSIQKPPACELVLKKKSSGFVIWQWLELTQEDAEQNMTQKLFTRKASVQKKNTNKGNRKPNYITKDLKHLLVLWIQKSH